MLFRTQIPSAPLARWVEMLWFYSGQGPAHRRERVLPDGTAELVINLDDVVRKRFDRHDPRRFQTVRRAWISGVQPESRRGSFLADCDSELSSSHRQLGLSAPTRTLRFIRAVGRMAVALRRVGGRILLPHGITTIADVSVCRPSGQRGGGGG